MVDRCVGVKADHGFQRSKLIFALLPLHYHTFTIFYNCPVKQDIFDKGSDISFVRNIDCGHSLKPRRF